MVLLLLLFIALGGALALLAWAELAPSRRAQEQAPAPPPPARNAPPAEAADAPPPEDAHDTVLARVAAGLAPAEAEADDTDATLTRVRGFAPGDLLELELDIPIPAPEEIRFEQAGPHTRVLIAGAPVLLIEDTVAARLTPEIFRFRSNA